jgi:hypothetical protein
VSNGQNRAVRVRNDFMRRRYGQMGRRSWNAPFRLCAKDDEVDLSEVREIQNAFCGITACDEEFRFAPSFDFRGDEFSEPLFRGLLNIEPGHEITGFWFRNNVE